MYDVIIETLYNDAMSDVVTYAIIATVVVTAFVLMLRFYLNHRGQTGLSNKNLGAAAFLLILSLYMLSCFIVSAKNAYLLYKDEEANSCTGKPELIERRLTTSDKKITIDGNAFFECGYTDFIHWRTGKEYQILFLEHSNFIIDAKDVRDEEIPKNSEVDSDKLILLGDIVSKKPNSIGTIEDIASRYIRTYFSIVNPEEWDLLSNEGYSIYGYLNQEQSMFFVEAYSIEKEGTVIFHIALDEDNLEPRYIWMEAD